MYQLVVGKGGVAPDYFLKKMQWWEVQPFIDGLNDRAHTQWESARMIAHTVACMFCKNVEKSQSEWLPFSWEHENGEDDSDSPEIDENYIAEMQAAIRAENARLQSQTADGQ